MSAKDKESKTLEKIKQFFRINRGVPGNLRPREDFVLSNVLEKDLCSESPTAQRIKTVKEIVETVLNHKLEDNAIAKLWYLLEDLVAPGNPKENRHVVFSFCRALIQGQYERLGMMRAQFFKFIKNHDVEEDIGPRLELLQSLTDHGRDILYLEEEMALFLLDWMPTVIDAGREQDFLQILINVIKYNTAYVDEELVASFVQSTCVLCCQSCNEEVVLTCLQVLDTVVCYTSLPPKSLSPFVATLCRTVNIEIYCPTSWKIMRNLLGTHLGHSSLYTMCTLLQCESSLSDVGLLRGAVFHINMALWGNKRVPSLKCTPTSVLPSFKMALRCKHSLVMYEVMLSVQRLVNKHGIELLDPSWSIVLVIIQTIIKDLENSPPSQCLNQISIHLHDTLTMVEQMIELGQFNGSVQTVFEIIESCSPHRPETSVLRLVSYLASSILPTRHLWLEKLESLVIKYFKQETRPNIRIKVLSILATVIQNNRSLYEEELVEIVLRYLGGIAQEGDIAVRSAAAQLLVDLCLNSEPKHALEVMDILEKLLNRAFEQNEIANSEEDAADIKMTAHGLVQALTNGLFSYPPAPAMRAFHLITNHLMTHYNEPKHLTNVTSIRYMMLECLLRLRADTHYRIGLCGPTTRYSMYLLAHNIAPQITSKVEMDVLPISNAIRAIIRAVKDELDWKVMLMVLQELPQLLKNRALLVSKSGSEVDLIATALCAMVCDKSLCLPEVLKNTPPKFTRSDLHNYVFPVLASLVSYHAYLEPKLQQRLIKCLEYGLVSRSARQCVLALTTCVLEMRDAMVKLLPEVLLNLSKISATVHIAIPILEFLSTLTQLPKVFANFVGDQYMSVFAISLPYTNPFTAYNHFTVSLAHHVIAAWFLKCRLPFRRDFVKYITNALKGNVKPFEDSLYKAEKVNEMVNEDSSNRKRSSSLTEQGSRKRERPVSTRLDLKPPIDEKLIEFHRELTETCIDLMAMYTFSTCSPQPKRAYNHERKVRVLLSVTAACCPFRNSLNTIFSIQGQMYDNESSKVQQNQGYSKRRQVKVGNMALPDLKRARIEGYMKCYLPPIQPVVLHSTAELLLSGGQSMTWLLGNKLITVTTSGCNLKALKHGLCDRCYQVCRINPAPDPLPSPTTDGVEDKRTTKGFANKNTEMVSNDSTAASTPDEEKPSVPDSDTTKLEHIHAAIEKTERQICGCWCQGWAEIFIRRPTGAMSWIMRLQNEPHSPNVQDVPYSDISSLFLSSTNSPKMYPDELEQVSCERVCSKPVSIPGSPVRRNVHSDFDDLEEGSGRSRNPVRRSNSSPEMSASWKNPLMNSSLASNADEADHGDGKKKQNYSKDLRVNCEAIPEEMGTTPPTCEPLMSPPVESVEAAKPPVVPSSPRMSKKEGESRAVDPSALPPLAFKRDRGHTISVMSPVRKPTGPKEWELKPRSPRSKEPQHRSGVNPSFVFLQLYHSAYFGTPLEKPLLVSNSQSALKTLDWIPPYEVHKIGVLYVGPGQVNSEIEILRNQYGSPRYAEFLQRLGTLINLAEADRQHVFLGGLDTNGRDGKFAYIWQDDVLQVIFHVATLMPNLANDPKATNKKLHIGNNFVAIVYNDSGEEYNFQTLKAQFNYGVVVVEPLEHGCNQVVVKAREELVHHICHTEYKIVSDQSVAILARQLAVHANLAALIASNSSKPCEPSAPNWLARLRVIKRLHAKLLQEQAESGDRSTTLHTRHNRRMHMEEFTDYT